MEKLSHQQISQSLSELQGNFIQRACKMFQKSWFTIWNSKGKTI